MNLEDVTLEQLLAEIDRRSSQEVPPGWSLMHSGDLVQGVHELYDPCNPESGWYGVNRFTDDQILVVARRIPS